MGRDWVSIQDAADYLSLHHLTIRKLIANGKLRAARPTGNGPWRISVASISDLMRLI